MHKEQLIQRCYFQRNSDSNWEDGIAFLNLGWGDYDAEFIIDANGEKVTSVWDYNLVDGIGSYIKIKRALS